MIVTTVVCDDGKVWQQNGQKGGWNFVNGPWTNALAERPGSGDGEQMTMKTRQTATEPLPASDLFWLESPNNTDNMNAHQKLALRALSNLRGDDTARARHAFSRCTPKEMQEQHGQSGKTRSQILAEYEAHDAKVDAAIAWVKAQG